MRSLRVNSRHHQAVKDLGRGLAVSARAEDGLIEGIELPDRKFVVGVQWHPESLSDRYAEAQRLFDALAEARSDRGCTLEEVCAAAAWAARWGGRFCLVFRPERVAELFSALGAAGFAVKRIRPVHHSPDKPVNLLLVEARRGGNPGTVWENDLYLHTADGCDTPEAARICHREKE